MKGTWIKSMYETTMKHYDFQELNEMETISQGHMDNLKVDTGTMRVWLSRMTIADGAPYNHQVTVEKLVNGIWTQIAQYKALG